MSGSSVSFYTLGNMRQAVCDSVTSEAAGFPKDNVMDFNPDTYWKTPSTAEQLFDFDFQAAVIIDACVILVHNYSKNHPSDLWEIWSSPDDTVYTSKGSGTFVGNATTQPLILEVTQDTKRYWRLSADAFNDAFEFSGVLWTRKYTIAQAAQWPERDIDRYHNRVVMAPGGREYVQSINLKKQEIFTRKYRLNEADMNTLRSVFNNCKGRMFPLVLQEGSADADARLVRFASDSLNENQLDFELYEPTVQFVEIPFIEEGESY